MIEMYIDQVVRHISPEQKEEAEAQIRKRIMKLLDGKTDEASIEKVLDYLGDPVTLSEEYEQTHYLIGPRMYKAYIKTLKIILKVVLIVSTASSMIATLISNLLRFEFKNSLLKIIQIIPNIVTWLIYTIVIVTAFFVIVERYMKEDTKVIIDYVSHFQFRNLFQEMKRRFEDKEDEGYFSKISIIVYICISTVLLTIVVFFGVLVDHNLIQVGVIDYNAFLGHQGELTIMLLIIIGFNAFRLFYKKWDMLMASLNSALSIAIIYVSTIVYRANGLANQQALNKIDFWFLNKEYTLGSVWSDIIFFVYLGIIIFCIISIINGFYRVFAQNMRKKKRALAKQEELPITKKKHYKLIRDKE